MIADTEKDRPREEPAPDQTNASPEPCEAGGTDGTANYNAGEGGEPIDISGLLFDVLGYETGEFVSINYQIGDGPWRTQVVPVERAAAVVAGLPNGADVYFGVNPVRGSVRQGARGRVEDVTRLAALFADLDDKPSGCKNDEIIALVVMDLSMVLETPASAFTLSGHGAHPYWPVEDGRITEEFTTADADALLKRFGRLAVVLAARRGAGVDNVFDAARVLRCPNTYNHKHGQRMPVVTNRGAGRPLIRAEIGERLDEYGIYQEEGDAASAEALSDPNGWDFAEGTCAFMRGWIDKLPGYGPRQGKGRHQWMVSQAVKLACAWRLGCVAEADLARAVELLERRLIELRAETGEGVKVYEVASALRYGVQRASCKTDEQARAELGDHTHGHGQGGFVGSVGSVGSVGDDLFDGEPMPLTHRVDIPPFPVGALPPVVADMVRAVSEDTQTDPAMAGTVALSVLSACVGGRAVIQVRGGWLEPLNTYTATIAYPGERKSAVQRTLAKPLFDAEKDLAEEGRSARLAAETRKKVALKAAERLQHAAASGSAPTEEAITAAQEAEAIEVPVVPRLIADDITPEAAASMLSDQGGRAAIISAEGGVFDVMAGRYSEKRNLDVWLKGHSGDALRVDRKGRPPEYIDSPALTLAVMIQPSVLGAIAANRDFRGRGLLARFLYSFPQRMVGHREIGTPVPEETAAAYAAAVHTLAKDMATWPVGTIVLRFSDAARDALQRVEEAVEPALAGDGELASLADWGAKYVGAIARLAGILHLAEHGTAGARKEVAVQTVEGAVRIGGYFKACAVNAFTEMGADTATSNALYLLERIGHLGQDEVSVRDMFKAARGSRFKKVQDMMPAVNLLVAHGYLAPVAQPPRQQHGGRPPSSRYRIHPHVTQPTEPTEPASPASSVGGSVGSVGFVGRGGKSASSSPRETGEESSSVDEGAPQTHGSPPARRVCARLAPGRNGDGSPPTGGCRRCGIKVHSGAMLNGLCPSCAVTV